jgi:outer membrane immunogenic protein
MPQSFHFEDAMKILPALAVLAAVTSVPAAAADMGLPYEAQTATAKPFTWRGVYFGAQLAYGWGKTEHTFSGAPPSGTSNTRGPLGGVYAGYNGQFSQFVLGVEGDIELADVHGSYHTADGISSTGSARMEWDASLRARVGTVFGRSLIYATGGLAFGGFEFKGGPNFNRFCCGYSDTLTGWTVGAGVEHALTSHLIGRLEYRYTDYGSASGKLPPSYPWVKMKTDTTTSVVRAGLAYKF